jgi:intracellular sulfur oxidation DsrE/DsrF family protein
MQRRTLLSLLAFGLAAPAAAGAAEEARAGRVVYQIDDIDKIALALRNMRAHHAGGPRGLKLAAVVYGPALSQFNGKTAKPEIKTAVAEALQRGDVLYACVNTLAALDWTLADLLRGFALAENGGVVKLADLQAQGWIYLRP